MIPANLSTKPSHRDLRWFAACWFPLFCAAAGGLILYHTGSLWAAVPLWAFGLAISIAGLLAPRLVSPVFVAWTLATRAAGWLISLVLLAAVFYFVLTPIGLMMRLLRHDPLQRKFDRSAASYWTPREQTEDPARYFRQF